MTSSSINILHNCSDVISPKLPMVSNKVKIGASASSFDKAVVSNDLSDDFELIENEKKKRRSARILAASAAARTIAVPSQVIPTASDTTIPVTSTSIRPDDAPHPLHSSNQIAITTESTRYAQTRYPFPPYCIRFNSRSVMPNHVKECLSNHCKEKHHFSLNVLNCRSPVNHSGNYFDILLYLKEAVSFSFLHNQKNWPDTFNSESYSLPSLPSMPPQLSLLVKHVDLRIDFKEFSSDVKAHYPEVQNVIRLKNKFQDDIKLVKLELTSPAVREKLLNDRKITIGYIVYAVEEYLAPAFVLICSKCMGIGHFKKQCSQLKSTCSTCGDLVDDLKFHKCPKLEKCIHCGENHKSNSLKCQAVKTFRAELTRKLLSPFNSTNSVMADDRVSMINQNLIYNCSNFPVIPSVQSSSSNVMMGKLNDVFDKLSEVNTHLLNLQSKYDRFERFMMEKNEIDASLQENLHVLSSQSSELKKDMVLNERVLNQHNNVLTKLLLLMLEELVDLILMQNQDKNKKPLNADLKLKMERYVIQLKKAKEGEQFTF